jgi:hypothetical protein
MSYLMDWVDAEFSWAERHMSAEPAPAPPDLLLQRQTRPAGAQEPLQEMPLEREELEAGPLRTYPAR